MKSTCNAATCGQYADGKVRADRNYHYKYNYNYNYNGWRERIVKTDGTRNCTPCVYDASDHLPRECNRMASRYRLQ